MTGLALYEAARKALANAVAVDEVREIHDRAKAMEAYSRQYKDKELEQRAIEIRKRAELRLGEMWEEQKATVGVATGTRGQLAGRDASGGVTKTPPENLAPTLSSAGIDKNLAKRARKAKSMSESEFEKSIDEAKAKVIAPKPPRRPRAVDRGFNLQTNSARLSVNEAMALIKPIINRVHPAAHAELLDRMRSHLQMQRDDDDGDDSDDGGYDDADEGFSRAGAGGLGSRKRAY